MNEICQFFGAALASGGPVPLFPGLPGGPAFLVLILLVGVAPAVLVYYDATEKRVRHRLLWTATTAVAGLVANVVGSGIVAILYALVGREYRRNGD